jgi:hypothetical protein
LPFISTLAAAALKVTSSDRLTVMEVCPGVAATLGGES